MAPERDDDPPVPFPDTAVSRTLHAATGATDAAWHNAAMPSSPKRAVAPPVLDVDTQFLETLCGYNARRAALHIISRFLIDMAPFGLRPVDFSVLSLIRHNPGITSRQLCAALSILPPNLVALIGRLTKRGLVDRHTHEHDRRAVGLCLSEAGEALAAQAEAMATQTELTSTAALTDKERKTLMRLLGKVYR